MNGFSDNNKPRAIQKYTASPQKSTKKESGRFRRFIEWISPHFKKKREQAERMLEAKIKREEGEARKAHADALNSEMDAVRKAQEIAEKAMKLDQASTRLGETEPASQQDLEEGLEKLKEIIKLLGLKHGTEVEIVEESEIAVVINDADLKNFVSGDSPTKSDKENI